MIYNIYKRLWIAVVLLPEFKWPHIVLCQLHLVVVPNGHHCAAWNCELCSTQGRMVLTRCQGQRIRRRAVSQIVCSSNKVSNNGEFRCFYSVGLYDFSSINGDFCVSPRAKNCHPGACLSIPAFKRSTLKCCLQSSIQNISNWSCGFCRMTHLQELLTSNDLWFPHVSTVRPSSQKRTTQWPNA